MTDEKRDRPTLRARPTPRPAPDRSRDPIDVPPPTPPAASQRSALPSTSETPTLATPIVRRREVTVQLGTRVSERTKDLLDDMKLTQGQDIRTSIERAIEEQYGHLLPRSQEPS